MTAGGAVRSGEDPFWDAPPEHSLFSRFSAAEWSRLRPDLEHGLTEADLAQLRSLGDAVSLAEVDHIYLALSRVLLAHYRAAQRLASHRARLFGRPSQRTPFIVAIAGSVAVGKSTTARIVQRLAQDWPGRPRVDLVTTDGFLLSTAELTARGLMQRKGFPESYDRRAMLRFLAEVKAGRPRVEMPVYSHLKYDIVPGETQVIDRPDMLVFEGLNVLQTPQPDPSGEPRPVASDFFDFSIYVDADPDHIRAWYVERFMRLRETAFREPGAHFAHYAALGEGEARAKAEELWATINAPNLFENILPTRPRANVVLRKGADHFVTDVALRRI